MKYFFALLVLFHGLIHFMGFSKAFGFGNIIQLTKDFSKPAGIIWFVTALLFIAVTILFLLKNESWIILAIIASILSQVLILFVWEDAKFGSIVNILIILVAVAGYAGIQFEQQFEKDVIANMELFNNKQADILSEVNIVSLPEPVQKYIRYSGALNQPGVINIQIEFDGEMRSKTKDWFKFETIQYNFFEEPTRLFFMKAKMFGIEVPGYHHYQNKTASMQVKLFGLIPVAEAKGLEMNKAETVTFFNDMCLFAPAALIDKRIMWEPVDSLSAKATFANGEIKISATLYFNVQGQLINFISDDRFDINDMKQYRFSTPVKEYKQINGRNMISYGEAIWHYPDEEFVYGKFYLRSIEYNTGSKKTSP